MKPVMVIGSIGAGKTSLAQHLAGQPGEPTKTQVATLLSQVLDTPGEYLDHHSLQRALLLASYDVDAVILVQSAVDGPTRLPHGFASYFTCPLIGVVNKIDIASPHERTLTRQDLERAGADPIVDISCLTGTGLDTLREVLA